MLINNAVSKNWNFFLLGADEDQSDDSDDIGVSNLFDDANDQDDSSTHNSNTEMTTEETPVDNVASIEEGNLNLLTLLNWD